MSDAPQNHTSNPMLDVATEAAKRAGKVLREKFRSAIQIRSKAPSDIVTEADLAAEAEILELIRASFPQHSILAEESGGSGGEAEHLWIVDPLDGTTNFVHGIPHVGVSIAYYCEGKPQVGVVLNPIRDDWYTAVRGEGAFANGQRAAVSESALSESLVGVGFYYDRGHMMQATLRAVGELFLKQIHGIRRMGTAALDLCQVGTGQFAAFFEYQLSPWDFAAGRLFVEEAGGRVTTCAGGQLPLVPSTVLAAGSGTYDDVLAIVRAHEPTG